MGKIPDDLREGKATLPLIIAMQRFNASARLILPPNLATSNNMAQIIAIVHRYRRIAPDAAAGSSCSSTPLAACRESLSGSLEGLA
jgi:octaprenyl-diphosphate synthase